MDFCAKAGGFLAAADALPFAAGREEGFGNDAFGFFLRKAQEPRRHGWLVLAKRPSSSDV